MAKVSIPTKGGRVLVTAGEAAKRFGIRDSYVRKLWHEGQLDRVEESPKCIFYYLDQLEVLLKEKAELRKQRGGRPRRAG